MIGSIQPAIEEVVQAAILELMLIGLLTLQILVCLSVLLQLSREGVLLLVWIIESIVIGVTMAVLILCVIVAATYASTRCLYSLGRCSLASTLIKLGEEMLHSRLPRIDLTDTLPLTVSLLTLIVCVSEEIFLRDGRWICELTVRGLSIANPKDSKRIGVVPVNSLALGQSCLV